MEGATDDAPSLVAHAAAGILADARDAPGHADADVSMDGPPAHGPGAELPLNVPTPAKPARAKPTPAVAYTDPAVLRHIFRFVHGIPGDANAEAVARATTAALKAASEQPRDTLPAYLQPPAEDAAAASESEPSWPFPLASLPNKSKLTLGAVRVTLKAHCVRERASVQTAAKTKTDAGGACASAAAGAAPRLRHPWPLRRPSRARAGAATVQVSMEMWSVQPASLAAVGIAPQPLAPFGVVRPSLPPASPPKATGGGEDEEGGGDAAAAAAPVSGKKRKAAAAPKAAVAAGDQENARPSWVVAGAAAPSLGAALAAAAAAPSSQTPLRAGVGGGGPAASAARSSAAVAAAAAAPSPPPKLVLATDPRVPKLRGAAAALTAHALSTYCGFTILAPLAEEGAAAAAPQPLVASGVPAVDPRAQLALSSVGAAGGGSSGGLGWAVGRDPEWVAGLAAAFWAAEPAGAPCVTAGGAAEGDALACGSGAAASAAAAPAWVWPDAHVKLLAALVQGAGATPIARLAAAVVTYLEQQRPATADAGAAAAAGGGSGTWLPPVEAVAERIGLLAELKSYGHTVKTAHKATHAVVADGPLLVSLLAGGSETDAAGAIAWHPALALNRWEVSNAAHLQRVDPKHAATHAAPLTGDAAAPVAGGAAAGIAAAEAADEDCASSEGGKAAAAGAARLSVFARFFASAATQQQRWLRLYGNRIDASARLADALGAAAIALAGANGSECAPPAPHAPPR